MTLVEGQDDGRQIAPLRVQYAALPYRTDKQGRLEILLVTSRETQRWVIPKGWPMKRRSARKAAEREALEEAGVRGAVSKLAVGEYAYVKRGPAGQEWPCRVDVFALAVLKEKPVWREHRQRMRRWFSAEAAAEAVEEAELKALIRGFSPRKG